MYNNHNYCYSKWHLFKAETQIHKRKEVHGKPILGWILEKVLAEI